MAKIPFILSGILIILITMLFQQFMDDKFYPFTYIGDKNVSFMTQAQAIQTIKSTFDDRSVQKLIFDNTREENIEIDLSQSTSSLEYSAITSAFESQHKGPFWNHLKKEVIRPKISIPLDKQIASLAASLDKQPKDAQLIFDESTGSARIQIKEAEDGFILHKEKLLNLVQNALLNGEYESSLPFKNQPPKISTSHVLRAKDALESVSREPLKLTSNDKTWIIDTKQLLTLLDLTKGESLLDYNQTKSYLLTIASETDQEVQEGLFEFNPSTKRVTAFKASREGRKLNIDKTFSLISDAASLKAEPLIELPIEIVKPKTNTEEVNNLGIKEMVGRGISNFAGSIDNRIYNIKLAASRINGVLIAPNQTFSFNQTVGDISEATGFKKAYVIKEGRTVLDDGGGVCQVSTTIFRAVLNAGLPVIKRTAHAYRVSYYEQGFPPGLDATVFYPSVDFQFKNDTGSHLLIQAYTVGTTLYVDLYGTSDGRVVNLTKPAVTNQTPPPPELRQDDPTLPRGTVKQVDWAAWGATVTFQRTVTRNNETLISETWKSVFKPWQAVYLVGTQ